MRNVPAQSDQRVAEIAAAQHGVITTAQLMGVGLGRSSIVRRVKAGRLHRVHRGVYAVGHAGISLEGRWMAAVLACGEGAVLSHRSAAALWGLLRPFEGPIDVSVPTHAGRERRAGIRVHRCETLAGASASARRGYAECDDQPAATPLVTVRHRIPVTTVARTIVDLRGVVPPKLHRRAIRQAELAGFALGPGVQTDGSRSDPESAFLALCASHHLPEPEVNVRVGRWTVDFLWRVERLAVETDSYRYHRGSVAFEDDHARDLELRRRGFEVRRFTARQLEEEPERVLGDLEAALRPA
jgi:very-short-patch-repair endonuclease